MAEKQQDLGHQEGPKRVTEGLTLASQAEKDFAEAINIVNGIEVPLVKTAAALIVSASLLRSGKESLIKRSELKDLEVEHTSNSIFHIVKYKAVLQAEMGDLDDAWETAKDYIPGQIAVAEIASRTQDPSELFRQINELSKQNGYHLGVNLETQRKLGIKPESELLDSYRESMFETPRNELWRRFDYVELFAQAGLTDEAYYFWRYSEDDKLLRRKALSMSKIAITEAENGGNPSGFIELAMEVADKMEPDPHNFYDPSRDQAYIYINIAKSLKDINPRPSIRRAMEYADKVDNNLQIDIYTDIARAQVEAGIESKPTIDLALKALEHYFQPDGSNDDYGIGIGNIIEIAKVQMEAGYFEDSKTTLQRLNVYEDFDKEYIQLMKVEIIAQIAERELKLALSDHI